MEKLLEVWKGILAEIKRSDRLTAEEVEHYLGQVEIEADRNGSVILLTPTLFHKEWLETRYRNRIRRAFEAKWKRSVEIQVWVRQEGGRAPRRGRSRRAASSPGAPEVRPLERLNEKYTFETFVVGSSNQFAHAAARAVAEAPGTTYNPLFLYGGVGLGKTHLMQAIGAEIRAKRNAKVLYASAEQFTNEFINAIKDKTMDAFQRKYRDVDVLLIDDIQFLANKDRSREEFFHTFNELYESRRQLVITSDRAPREIPLLEDRLRSRLEWGLIADIKPPDLELRMAILRRLAEEAGTPVDDECLQYIAGHIRSNIRELEGALLRVVAMASLTGQAVTLDLAKEALRDFLSSRYDGNYTTESIVKAVADYFNLSPHDIKSKRRSSHVALARHIAIYLTRDLLQISFPVIATEFGGRDHTTVLYSYRKIKDLVESDRRTQSVVEEIRRTLGR
ncbi:MAG: chromosomal replication initiator protein DnaA [Actinomycetota bacterium]|nr:MAG: chromosomal replication initiator protein DnaA [Actinomycetota bacterium]